MKKILLATSVLAATTGFAAAEVTVSGSARMGVIYDGTDTLFTSRVRVNFDMVGTTDGGVEFGASTRADKSGQGNTANDDTTVYVSMNGLKLTMGDNDSAANALVGHVSGVGLTGLGDWNELRYLGQTDTSVLVEYTAGALSFAASSSQLDAADEAISVAAKYSTDAYTVALGYEDATLGALGSVGHLALKGQATFGAFTVKAVISDTDIAGDDTQFALSADFAAGGGSYTVFVTDEGDVNNYGIGASYDLGGGASIVGGIVRVDGDNFVSGENETVADLGISMSF
jgi:outer membrane protein OmpU